MSKRASLAAVAAVALVVAAGPVSSQVKWDMATAYPDGNFHTKNNREFAEEVAKASGGKLQIVVHSNASLIKMPEIKRAVQTGQVPAGEIAISVLANESAVFAFDSNPFLSNSYAKANKLWQAAKPVVTKRMDAQGIRILYSVAWPPQGIYTKKDVDSLADLKGSKFRTYSPTTSRFAELIGTTPTLVQQAEVPQAFRTGLVDAMITSGATGVDTQAWDYLSHFYDTRAMMVQNVVFTNKAAFDRLDAATQRAVLAASEAAEARGWKTSEAENENHLKILASKGIKVLKPSAKLMAEFEAVGRQMTEEWVKRAGPEGEAILASFRK